MNRARERQGLLTLFRIWVCFGSWKSPRHSISVSSRAFRSSAAMSAFPTCKWRGLPQRFGNWHALYTRMNRWSNNGVLERVFEQLQREQIVRIKIEAVQLDSTIV